jgi:hypothetical protein
VYSCEIGFYYVAASAFKGYSFMAQSMTDMKWRRLRHLALIIAAIWIWLFYYVAVGTRCSESCTSMVIGAILGVVWMLASFVLLGALLSSRAARYVVTKEWALALLVIEGVFVIFGAIIASPNVNSCVPHCPPSPPQTYILLSLILILEPLLSIAAIRAARPN